ncbi:MAG: hypothetical protein CR997_12510 [Acidobacteria bacterium]|nr:MAG: hypothetical protein CR997_12510 [Acidobacteriota bacterium]
MKEQKKFEQFFFDVETRYRLFNMAAHFKKPLFLCTPTLAEMAQREGRKYLLLDRDQRFRALKGYRYFDLFKPHFIEEPFDAIFCDPPFSNISIPFFYKAIQTINGFQMTENVFICYISSNQKALLDTFSDYHLVRYPESLRYQSVKRQTQEKIFLFGPGQFLKYDAKKNSRGEG